MVRRLPVLQTPAADDAEAAERPAWHWVLIGAAFVVTFMLPLWIAAVWVGSWFARRQSSLDDNFAGVLALLVAFALGVGGSGALVGRFDGRRGVGIPALGGALGGLLLFVIALLLGELSFGVALAAATVLCVAGALFAALGGLVGLRTRPK